MRWLRSFSLIVVLIVPAPDKYSHKCFEKHVFFKIGEQYIYLATAIKFIFLWKFCLKNGGGGGGGGEGRGPGF